MRVVVEQLDEERPADDQFGQFISLLKRIVHAAHQAVVQRD
jgi:hypothetical protein